MNFWKQIKSGESRVLRQKEVVLLSVIHFFSKAVSIMVLNSCLIDSVGLEVKET